ncbi:hypothetical protein [Govanella unica]|uniref:Uncharacterized protein n=1 Tax=Govanella unica TaxID=2975056 RepID=A0A9X3Z6M7_9PROT|nr:hypothetical protein [Govania unica]MDA5193173.1 hypothetical protein [Govania unica]
MFRTELEKRVRHLEEGLTQFNGLDWIIKVGEIAEIKGAVLDMTAETEAYCAQTVTTRNLQRLDVVIRTATTRKTNGHLAFQKAYGTLRTWLTPALPGERRIGKLSD